MATVLKCIVTAMYLLSIETILSVVTATLLHFLDHYITSIPYRDDAFFLSMILKNYAIISGIRILYGFVLAAALALLPSQLNGNRVSWIELGCLNVLALLAMCLIWEKQFQLLDRLKSFDHPFEGNFMHITLAACFFSPWFLKALRLPGNLVPQMTK